MAKTGFDFSTYLYILLFIGVYAFFAYIVIVEKRKKMGKSEVLKPAFNSTIPKKIKYSKNPINKSQNYLELSPEIIAGLCHLKQWTESLLISKQYRKKKYAIDTPKEIQEKIRERLQNPLDCFVVCEIDERVGKGVFLGLNEKPLPANLLIGIYAGEYRSNKQYKLCTDFTYGLSLVGISGEKNVENSPFIDATFYGNITRMFQDLPSTEELDALNLDEEMQKQIATENLRVISAVYQDFPIMYFITLREINPGEQLGFSYRGDYWGGIIGKRQIFDKAGRIIGHFMTSKTAEFELNNKLIKSAQNQTEEPIVQDNA